MRSFFGSTYPCGYELVDILRETAEQATGSEDDIGKEETSLPTKDFAKSTVQWLEGGQGQKIRSRNPAGQIESF
jgi:hypothetical protein